jgi:hypothetical protein
MASLSILFSFSKKSRTFRVVLCCSVLCCADHGLVIHPLLKKIASRRPPSVYSESPLTYSRAMVNSAFPGKRIPKRGPAYAIDFAIVKLLLAQTGRRE